MADAVNVEGPLGEDLFDTEGAEEEDDKEVVLQSEGKCNFGYS